MESQIESVKALDAYRLRQVKHIPELNSDGMILEHKKTGANIFLMSNEDNNKVFCIGFRTRRQTAPAFRTSSSIPCSAALINFR